MTMTTKTIKTTLSALALTAMALTTTTAFAAENVFPPAEHGRIEHGPVEVGHGPVKPREPVGGPIARDPVGIVGPFKSTEAAKTQPSLKDTKNKALTGVGTLKARPQHCPNDPGFTGAKCPGPGGPVAGPGGYSGGGGTEGGGGVNAERCFEEFRCDTSVD
jgi:hypothetical protein